MLVLLALQLSHILLRAGDAAIDTVCPRWAAGVIPVVVNLPEGNPINSDLADRPARVTPFIGAAFTDPLAHLLSLKLSIIISAPPIDAPCMRHCLCRA